MPPASAVRTAIAAIVIPATAPGVSFDPSEELVDVGVVVLSLMAAPVEVAVVVPDVAECELELDVVLAVVLSGMQPLVNMLL
jgi:hypothetical protein